MKKNAKLLKILILFVTLILFIITAIITYLYLNLKSNTPTLSHIAQKVGKPTFAVAFNYTVNTDRQLYQFSKNIGLENNPRTQQPVPPIGEIGARGFFILDIYPQFSEKIITSLDNILNDFLSTSESLDENEFFDPTPTGNQSNDEILNINDIEALNHNEDKVIESDGSPFAKPLTSLIEEIWNGKTFLIGGATQLQLSIKDSILLAIEPNIKKSLHLSSDTLKSLVLKNVPLSIQNFLGNHAIELSIESLEFDEENKINHSQVILSISDPIEFLNSICSQKINPWDFCGRFSFQRNNFRKNLESVLSLLNNNFNIKLDMYWSIKGQTFIFSNQKNFVSIISSDKKENNLNNILTTVSSSGADFLLPTDSLKNFSSISFLFDMIQTQNKLIDFSDRIRKKSSVLSDYFSSPAGDIMFSEIEKTINTLTSYSENASLTLDTDGDKLIPKIRLYAPTGDLFIKQGKEVNPEALNTIKIFITKAVSFGNFLLPRGLIPLPGPYIQKNGKWVIIQSEINVKSIAPYLESIDPYIDNSEDPTKL